MELIGHCMNVSEEDIERYYKCKENLHRCKYVGITECEGCEYDLAVDKIEYINS